MGEVRLLAEILADAERNEYTNTKTKTKIETKTNNFCSLHFNNDVQQVLKLVQVFSETVNKGGAENFDLQNLRVPGMVVSGKLFRRRKGHFKQPLNLQP